jgi:hypothetical protein
VQLLVQWRAGKPQETAFTANPTPEDPDASAVRGVDAGPLPLTTPLDYEWVTVQQLIDANAYLMAMDSRMLTPFDTTFSNPWVPLSTLSGPGSGAAAAAGGANDKAKEKPAAKGKDKGAAVEAPVVEEHFADPGMMPVTLLRLNTSEFFAEHRVESHRPPQLERQSSISMSGKHHPLKPEVRKVMRQGALAETAAALRDQQLDADRQEEKELSGEEEEARSAKMGGRSFKGGARSEVVPVADFLHFTVMIHADAVLEYREDPAATTSSAASAAVSGKVGTEEAAGVATHVVSKKTRHMLPSAITLVLQEVRTDAVEPLMFVMELKEDSYMPMISKSFAVSTKRLSADPAQPLVFWLRLFSKASVYMHFSAEVGLSVGPAEQVWSAIGKSVFLKEGRCEATRSQTQQLVFRLPLVCEAPASEAAGESKGGGEGDDQSEEDDHSFSGPAEAHAVTFLQVADRNIDRFLSLGLLPADSTLPLAPLPRTQGNIVRLHRNPADASTLLGRSFPSALHDKAALSVPPFSWKLLILSDVPIKEPVKPINEETVTQRFLGKFVANNKNALFRDIYTVDKLSFPLAFRLTTTHDRPVTGSAHARDLAEKSEKSAFAGLASDSARKALRQALTVKGKRKELCLSVKLYRAVDMQLVTEFKGRESVICYHLGLDKFLPEGETFDVAAALAAANEAKAGAGGKGGKAPAAKPGAKGGAPTTSDSVDILVECTLDHDAMRIEPDWLSRFPHVYDGLFPDSSHPASAKPSTDAAAADKGKKGEAAVDPEEAARRNMEVVAAQHECLGVTPPSKTLVKWQLDVLAGKVLNISHDTSALARDLAIKNSWEDASAGRGERSAAALRYYQERRAAMKRQLEEASRPGTASGEEKTATEASAPTTRPTTSHGGPQQEGVVPLTSGMTESLGTALGAGELDALARRYTILNNLPSVSLSLPHLQCRYSALTLVFHMLFVYSNTARWRCCSTLRRTRSSPSSSRGTRLTRIKRPTCWASWWRSGPPRGRRARRGTRTPRTAS